MNKFNRDLLVLFKEESNSQSIESEVDFLHELLSDAEQIENLVSAYEIVNINKRKIYSDRKRIEETINHKKLKPFIFLNNKN
ncbi:MAG: hypothetical protein ABIN48_00950 [Ginsengibacter sp.]